MNLNLLVQLNPDLKIASLKFIAPKPVSRKLKKKLSINCQLITKANLKKKRELERIFKKFMADSYGGHVWNLVDHTQLTAFQKRVYHALLLIKQGQTKSYKEIAQAIGAPKAVRAVGQALKKNPFPLLFPCHRVIKSNGNLGGFSGGADLKAALLQFESGR